MGQNKQGVLLKIPAGLKKGAELINYKTLLYTNPHIDLSLAASGLQKGVRQGWEEFSLQMAFLILPKFPFYLWRRLAIISSEDVGPGNHEAAMLVSSLYNSWVLSRAKKSEFTGRVLITHAVLYLCRSGKNRENDNATWLIGNKLEHGEKIILPDIVKDMHTAQGKRLGRGVKHFLEEASKIQNEQGTDSYRAKMIDYIKKIGKYI